MQYFNVFTGEVLPIPNPESAPKITVCKHGVKPTLQLPSDPTRLYPHYLLEKNVFNLVKCDHAK
jgi:hypothetical protein